MHRHLTLSRYVHSTGTVRHGRTRNVRGRTKRDLPIASKPSTSQSADLQLGEDMLAESLRSLAIEYSCDWMIGRVDIIQPRATTRVYPRHLFIIIHTRFARTDCGCYEHSEDRLGVRMITQGFNLYALFSGDVDSLLPERLPSTVTSQHLWSCGFASFTRRQFPHTERMTRCRCRISSNTAPPRIR
jgi:hypothetical protein